MRSCVPTSDVLARRARQTVDELAANGAVFTYRPATGVLPASFVYEIAGSGDRRRCRHLVMAAKGDTALWAAVVAEIERRCREMAA